MPQQIRLWSISDEELVEISQAKLDLESRLEAWLLNDISILGLDLLIIGQQVETEFGGYIDLLCIDPSGDLTIVELKRDKTPRDITAQVIDYASWVVHLSAEDISEIASEHLGADVPLEQAFREAFDSPLPDVLNEGHQLLVVGAQVDSSSERIIQYLSDSYGVNINAVTFQYFKTAVGDELIGRVFLLEPTEMESRVSRGGRSKRRPSLSREELERIAEDKGIGDLYRSALSHFEPIFHRVATTRSSLRFVGQIAGGNNAVLNLIPTGEVSEALPFQLYTNRAATLFGKSADAIRESLPEDTEPWAFGKGPEWWQGHAGSFRSTADIASLRDALT